MVDFVQLPQDNVGKKVMTSQHTVDAEAVQVPVHHLADRTDPSRQQSVHPDGSAYMRFSAGNPTFDSFEHLMVSDDNLQAAYKFYDGPKSIFGRVAEEVVGGGAVGFDPVVSGYKLSCGTADGDSAKIVSHRHFPYKPGSSVTLYFVMKAGDTGKANLKRRVGLMNFDGSEGIYLESDNGMLYAGVESTLGNSQREPITNWSHDRLDGSGGDFNRSGVTIDPTKMQIFGITYQYLSAGVVELFSYIKGEKVLLQQFDNYSSLEAPFMGTTDLAYFIEQTNNGVTGSSSELFTYCAVVIGSGYDELIRTPLSIRPKKKVLNTSDLVPVMSFRPAQTYFGDDNRYRYLFETLSATTRTEEMELCLVMNGVLTNPTWSEQFLGLEVDSGASALTGGHNFGSLIFTTQANPNMDLSNLFNDMTDGLYRHADIADTDIWTICVKNLADDPSTEPTTAHVAAIALEVQ
ncbi:hypothetical protein N9112_00070 [bacterium]|nr:hypothetical protein [bacterium]